MVHAQDQQRASSIDFFASLSLRVVRLSAQGARYLLSAKDVYAPDHTNIFSILSVSYFSRSYSVKGDTVRITSFNDRLGVIVRYHDKGRGGGSLK